MTTTELIERLRYMAEHGPLVAYEADMVADPALVADALERMQKPLERALAFLRSAPLESGVCCCGDPVESHNYGSGHAPVDELAYHAGQIADEISAALEKRHD